MIKDINCYGNGYMVDDSGNVYGKNGRPLKQHGGITSKYLSVSLSHNGKAKKFMTHRLVALAFVDNPQRKTQVNHIDGNIFNNSAENLEWVTPSENMIHSYHKLGNKKGIAPMTGRFGYEHNKSKEIVILTPEGKKLKFGSALEMNRETGYSHTAVSEAAKHNPIPYTFKKGKNKGMTILKYNFQLAKGE